MDLVLETTPEHPHKVKALVAARCATIPEHLHHDSEGLLRARNAQMPIHSYRFSHVDLFLETTPEHPHKIMPL